jgi:phosphatidylglycerophosphate synthase
MAESLARGAGAKARDYWWTVIAVDPVALPLARLLAARRWLSPDQTTLLSVFLGLPVGIIYALDGRAGLVVGAVLFYLSFVFDCVDGKLARLLGETSARGRALDQMADGARRASASLGLGVYLWRQGRSTDLLWAATYAVLSFYFMEISGASKEEPRSDLGGRWASLLARRRLLPTPGTPDASALVFVIGPLTGLIVAALAAGIVMMIIAILITIRRRLRARGA